MRAVVTGGAGFIGSHLVTRLLELGHDVRVIDNFSSGKHENLAHLGHVGPRLDVVAADVRDAPRMVDLVAGHDVVFHEAAVVSVPYSVEHPQETHDVNIQGTLNVLLAARHGRVRRVVFASSAAVYGDAPGLPKVETMTPTPIAPYGVEKLTGEHYLAVFARLYGLETVALRYFNVFGPRQDPSSPYSGVISVFCDRIRRGAPLTIFGDGTAYRDFVHVNDVVCANLLAAQRPGHAARGGPPGVSGRVFNVARGESTSLAELASILGRIANKELSIHLAPPRAGDIAASVADIALARELLEYAPEVEVEDGLRSLVS